jgi:hypothetical protein
LTVTVAALAFFATVVETADPLVMLAVKLSVEAYHTLMVVPDPVAVNGIVCVPDDATTPES